MFIKDWKKDIFSIPNLLSLLRLILIPVYIIIYLNAQDATDHYLAAGILAVSCLTDLIDGKIARRDGLVTDFGKFIDPLADKFMVIGSLVSITVANEILRPYMIWVSIIVIFRELGITSIRLVVANSGVVVPANWLGKCKTMAQSISIVVFLVENLIWDRWILSYVGMTVTANLTLWSGIEYFAAYWKYIDPEK